MLKLNASSYNHDETIQLCKEGITGDIPLLDKVCKSEVELKQWWHVYEGHASSCNLYEIKPQIKNEKSLFHVGKLNKYDLVKLYNDYFVPKKKPARKIYDALLVAAKGKCPFCGGIGNPTTLDHYLPKQIFSQFSILPINLVPSCKDCNLGEKKKIFPSTIEEQVIHPYLDDVCYFTEKWLSAQYIPGDALTPSVVEYSVTPPTNWEDFKKHRVRNHFELFNLGMRFSREATTELSCCIAQIQYQVDKGVDFVSAKATILEPVIATILLPNDWKRVMYQVLLSDMTTI